MKNTAKEALSKNNLLFQECRAWSEMSECFDIFDLDTYSDGDNTVLMLCREENMSRFAELFRVTICSEMGPRNVTICTPEGIQIVRIQKSISMFGAKIQVFGEYDRLLGHFLRRKRYQPDSYKLTFVDTSGASVFTADHNDVLFGYSFYEGEKEIASITRQYNGIARALLARKKNYQLEISDKIPAGSKTRRLLLAVVIIYHFSFARQA